LQAHQLTPAASKREKEGAKGKKGQTKKKMKKQKNTEIWHTKQELRSFPKHGKPSSGSRVQ